MSRDGAPPKPVAGAPSSPSTDGADGADGLELLAAYVDGVTELSPDDRRQIEARLGDDAEARAEQAAVRRLLDRLREPGGLGPATEPDWAAMERSIRDAVGEAVPRPWWRRWRWIAPAATFACALTVALAMWPHPAPGPRPELPVHAPAPHAPAERPAPAAEPTEVVPLWLDGAEVDVDVALVPRGSELFGELGEDEADAAPAAALEATSETADPADTRLLPTTDLAWVDHLDDAALERAERWLAGRPGNKG